MSRALPARPRARGEPVVDQYWPVVAGAFGASFVAFLGLFNYGIFLDALSREFDAGKGLTAAVFSVTTFVYYLSGMVAGRLADRFGPRPVIGAAAVLVGVGFGLGSLAQSLWQLGLIWALTLGPGVGASYSPLVAAVGAWFEQRRALALGLALSGAGAGIMAGAPICSALLRAFGWRSAFALIGAGSALVLAASAWTARPRPGVHTGGPASLRPLLRTRTFALMFLAVALLSVAFFTPFVFLASYAESRGIGPATTALIVGLIGFTSTTGRLVLAAVGGRLGEVRIYQISFGLMTASYVVWLLAGSSAAALALYSVLMGTGYGGFVALGPAVLARTFGPERLGGLVGTLYSAFAIGSALSPPLIGWLTDTVGAASGIAVALASAAGALVATLGLPEREVLPGGDAAV
ncbi:MAG: MFS transporter [Acidimicrobiales bacterium]